MKLFNRNLTKRHKGTLLSGNFFFSIRALVPQCEVLFRICLITLLFIAFNTVNAQDDFGFGSSDNFGFGSSDNFDFGSSDDFGFGDSGSFGFSGNTSPAFHFNIGGEVSAGITLFYDDFGSAEGFKNIRPGEIFSGSLSFDAGNSFAQGIIKLNLIPVFDGSSPITLDEAFLRAFFGPVTVEGGLRKLTWGKADSFGPLDVINPLDYSDLSKLSDPQSVKLARPMLHASWSIGAFSRLEAVFVPWFKGHEFDSSGRWTPIQVKGAYNLLAAEIEKKATAFFFPIYLANIGDGDIEDKLSARRAYLGNYITKWSSSFSLEDLYPDTHTLMYAQGGLRFTTSIRSSDLGIQYYFGRLPRPAVRIKIDNGFLSPGNPLMPMDPDTDPDIDTDAIIFDVDNNYYHQIGVDFARVIWGFNLRSEAGVNITGDLDGMDGAIENPAFFWSLGFDRDLFAGIKLNLQGTERIRLFNRKVNGDPALDCEAGSNLSSTRITGILSRKFLRDELELKLTGLWGIEDKDFLIMPGLIWTRNDVSAELSAGFFGGDKKGELGQYHDNGYIKIILAYKF